MDSAIDQVKNEFEKTASSYDMRWAKYNLGSHLATIRNLPLRGDERILDLGCGTGELERHIQCKWPGVTVVGVDLCQKMVTHAREKFSKDLPIRFLCANAQALPFPAGTFDLVVSSSAFHFIPDSEAALNEVKRVVVPGGRIVITDWCADYFMCRVVDLWLRVTGRAAHAGSLRSTECSDLARKCGIHVQHIETYRVGWIWGLMTCVGTSPTAAGSSTDTAEPSDSPISVRQAV